MTCNVQRKFPRPLLKKFYHHSYIPSCIEETLGEGINFVWKNSNGRLLKYLRMLLSQRKMSDN